MFETVKHVQMKQTNGFAEPQLRNHKPRERALLKHPAGPKNVCNNEERDRGVTRARTLGCPYTRMEPGKAGPESPHDHP